MVHAKDGNVLWQFVIKAGTTKAAEKEAKRVTKLCGQDDSLYVGCKIRAIPLTDWLICLRNRGDTTKWQP